jgi:hypothetical protein
VVTQLILQHPEHLALVAQEPHQAFPVLVLLMLVVAGVLAQSKVLLQVLVALVVEGLVELLEVLREMETPELQIEVAAVAAHTPRLLVTVAPASSSLSTKHHLVTYSYSKAHLNGLAQQV